MNFTVEAATNTTDWACIDDLIEGISNVNLLFTNFDNSLNAPALTLKLKPESTLAKDAGIRIRFKDTTHHAGYFDGTTFGIGSGLDMGDSGSIEFQCEVPTVIIGQTEYNLFSYANDENANTWFTVGWLLVGSNWKLYYKYKNGNGITTILTDEIVIASATLAIVKFEAGESAGTPSETALTRTYKIYLNGTKIKEQEASESDHFPVWYDNLIAPISCAIGGQIIELDMEVSAYYKGKIVYAEITGGTDDIYFGFGHSLAGFAGHKNTGEVETDITFAYENLPATYMNTVTLDCNKTVWKGFIEYIKFSNATKQFTATVTPVINARHRQMYSIVLDGQGDGADTLIAVPWIENESDLYYKGMIKNLMEAVSTLDAYVATTLGYSKLYYKQVEQVEYSDLTTDLTEGYLYANYFTVDSTSSLRSFGQSAFRTRNEIYESQSYYSASPSVSEGISDFMKLGYIIYYNGITSLDWLEAWQIKKCYDTGYNNLTIDEDTADIYDSEEVNLSRRIFATGQLSTVAKEQYEATPIGYFYKMYNISFLSQNAFESDVVSLLYADWMPYRYKTDADLELILNVETIRTDAFLLTEYYNNLIEYFVEFKEDYAFAKIKIIEDR